MCYIWAWPAVGLHLGHSLAAVPAGMPLCHRKSKCGLQQHIYATLDMFTYCWFRAINSLPVSLLFCLWLQVRAGLLMRRMCVAS